MNARPILTTSPLSPLSIRDATDDALVSLLRSGSRPAAGELYRRHASALRAALRSRVSTDDAEDIVQNVFCVLLVDPRFTPAPGRLRPWLRGIANRMAAKRRSLLVEEKPVDGEALLCDDAWPTEDDELEAGVNEVRGR